MKELVTTESILSWIKEAVEQKKPIDTHTWIDACVKLNVLIGDENSKLFELQQAVSQLKVMRIESGDTVAKAEVYVRATDEYKYMKKQEAKIEQIHELIRISKIQARMSNDEFKGY